MACSRRYNVQQISFLIGSFRQVVQSFGKDSKTVEFFRGQTDGLVSLGQLNAVDANFVYRLLGMESTNAVKWDITDKRLNEFNNCMNYLIQANNSDQLMEIVTILKNKGLLTSVSYSYIQEIYGLKDIDSYDLPKQQDIFGRLNTTIKDNRTSYTSSAVTLINFNTLKEINRDNIDDVVVRITCSDVEGCSYPTTVKYNVSEALATNDIRKLKEMTQHILSGERFEVGHLGEGDPCRGGKIWVSDGKLTADFNTKINFKTLLKELKTL